MDERILRWGTDQRLGRRDWSPDDVVLGLRGSFTLLMQTVKSRLRAQVECILNERLDIASLDLKCVPTHESTYRIAARYGLLRGLVKTSTGDYQRGKGRDRDLNDERTVGKPVQCPLCEDGILGDGRASNVEPG